MCCASSCVNCYRRVVEWETNEISAFISFSFFVIKNLFASHCSTLLLDIYLDIGGLFRLLFLRFRRGKRA